jgi:hypothetical protein
VTRYPSIVLILLGLIACPAHSQEPVRVGAGSYAASPPPGLVVDKKRNVDLVAETEARRLYLVEDDGRPIPSNKWYQNVIFNQYGTGLWASAHILIGYFFSRSIESAAEYAGRGFFVLATTIVVVAGTVVLYRRLRVDENREAAVRWMERHAATSWIVALARRFQPQLRFFWERVTPGGTFGLEFTTLMAILAVSRDLQDLRVSDMRASGNGRDGGPPASRPLYQVVAEKVAREWNGNGNCALVVGATWPEQLREVRAIVGDVPFLVPGIGAQGGDVEAVVTHAKTADGTGLVVSSSRAILYASSGGDFAVAAASAAKSLRDEINRYR